MNRLIVRFALYTAFYLFGGMLLSFGAAFGISSLPMHLPQSTSVAISFAVFVSFTCLAGALWGRSLARLSGSQKVRAMTLAGGLCFGPALLLTALALGRLEVALVEQGRGPDLPIHVVFTLLFVPAAFVVAGSGGLALGLAYKDGRLALQSALGSGAAGALGFLLVNLAMDTLGWRVGAPGAAARATMLVVMMSGSLGAALCAGGALGFLLTNRQISGILAPGSEIIRNRSN